MASKPGPSTSMGGGANMSAGAGSSASSASSTPSQEFTVRVLKDRKKKLSLMKFASGVGVDFANLGNQSVKLERENNLKEYKTANDIDLMPKFGAGSEYGRDQKEEARRKKFGIILKKYNPEEQPWHLKIGNGKQARKYRGIREGTVSENTSYYIFTQCADGAFEAFPVEEWYNFSPMIRYKYLNSDEAEEEFSRRGKTLNYFNIMLKKRVKNEDKDPELEEEEKGAKRKASKSKKKNKDFMLTDMDDWADISDDEDMDEGDEDEDDEGGKDDGVKKKKKPKGKAAAAGKKKVKNAKQNSDDEAIEESDEGDFDDREVDYMSDTSSSGHSEPEEKEKKYEVKGVADEQGVRNFGNDSWLNSDEEDEEDEAKEEEELEEEEKKDDEKSSKEKKGTGSSSSSSDSDSDLDKDEKITAALFIQKNRMDKNKPGDKGDNKGATSASTDSTDSKQLKRKAEGDGPAAKKPKKDHLIPSSSSSSNDAIIEDTIRRYLQRKPMTTRALLQKFRSKKMNMTNEQMSHAVGRILTKLNPHRRHVNRQLYLSLKKAE